ncbi:predicted protein [Botrytis cinerea T4]|uniref:Uncharacterized protein n=1 Tax=Botryotinia fuckeliana (strain T4) TaxID=999810 RepID=G2XN26_BOTF4|nr:predicted protein [Botrytis cinerea T4]
MCTNVYFLRKHISGMETTLELVPARCILDADESVPVKVDKNVVADTYAEEKGIEERSMV